MYPHDIFFLAALHPAPIPSHTHRGELQQLRRQRPPNMPQFDVAADEATALAETVGKLEAALPLKLGKRDTSKV